MNKASVAGQAINDTHRQSRGAASQICKTSQSKTPHLERSRKSLQIFTKTPMGKTKVTLILREKEENLETPREKSLENPPDSTRKIFLKILQTARKVFLENPRDITRIFFKKSSRLHEKKFFNNPRDSTREKF